MMLFWIAIAHCCAQFRIDDSTSRAIRQPQSTSLANYLISRYYERLTSWQAVYTYVPLSPFVQLCKYGCHANVEH